MQKGNKWIFTILPAGLFIYALFSIKYVGYYFLWSVDPEYAYLFNGVTLSYFKLHLNCVGHPGTPIQCIIAITARIVHLFRPGSSLFDDVMTNPEVYIRWALYAINAINFSFLFLLGIRIFRYSGNMILAVAMQLTPFAFAITMEVSRRLMPESIMVSIVSLWLMLFFKILYEPEGHFDGKRYSLLFALLFGFSLADKLTFLPYFLIPLFLLPGIKLKIRYTLLATIFFLLFAFPVLFNFHKFTNWVVGIFTHKGVYGGGEKGIVDLKVFYWNALTIVRNTYRIIFPLIALNAALILYFLKRNTDKKIIVITLGITSLIVFSYIITAKHYAFYYLTPTLLLTIFIFYLLMEILKKIWPVLKKNRLTDIGLILFGCFLLFNSLQGSFRESGSMKKSTGELIDNYKHIHSTISNHPKIISASYYGCSAHEYSLLFGLQESGKYGRWLTGKFRNLFPDTYIYYPWSGLFYDGVYVVKPASFLKKGITYSLYISEYSGERFDQVMKSLQQDTLPGKILLKEVFKSPSGNEAVFNMTLRDESDDNQLLRKE